MGESGEIGEHAIGIMKQIKEGHVTIRRTCYCIIFYPLFTLLYNLGVGFTDGPAMLSGIFETDNIYFSDE